MSSLSNAYGFKNFGNATLVIPKVLINRLITFKKKNDRNVRSTGHVETAPAMLQLLANQRRWKKNLWFQSKIITVAKRVSKHTLPSMLQCVVSKPPYHKNKNCHRSQCNVGRTRRHGSFHVTATCKSTSLKQKSFRIPKQNQHYLKNSFKMYYARHSAMRRFQATIQSTSNAIENSTTSWKSRAFMIFVLIWNLGMCMGNANKKFKRHVKQKKHQPQRNFTADTAEPTEKNKKMCNLKKRLISQMITMSTKNQSEQSFGQAHAIRSTELKPNTPRSGKTKTCTDKNIPNQNMNTNLDLFWLFMILNHKQNTMYWHHGTPHRHKRCRDIRFSRRLRHRKAIQHANC